MAHVSNHLRRRIARYSPRRRRWERFLRELPLAVEELRQPIDSPSIHDSIICGASRTGTTLLAAQLFQPPACLSVVEPWDGMRLPPAELFEAVRTDITDTGRLRSGRLDVDALTRNGKVEWCRDGERPIGVDLHDEYHLTIKWPAFWRYLDHLPTTKFLVCVRHPVEVIASFRRVGGRLAEGLDYDTAFNAKMNTELLAATSDVALRRVLLYEYINRRMMPFLDRANVFAVRYERWFEDPQRLMSEIGEFLGTAFPSLPVPIEPRTTSSLPPDELDMIRAFAPSAKGLGYVI